MTTEMSSTLSAAGLGQSTAVSIGGDAIIGQTYAELMPLFEADAQTEAIVIYTEPGGRMEAQLAAWVTEQRLAAADRRLHGRPLHGRDAGHVLRARRHDRRGQGGHGDGEDRPPRAPPGSSSPSGSRTSPGLSSRASPSGKGAADEPTLSSTSRSRPRPPRTPRVAAKLAEVCPVDIYAVGEDGELRIVEDNLDECVLCRLCIDAAPPGTVTVRKLYDGGAALGGGD